MTKKRSAHIALIGAPNVGKSTLTNFLVEQKISIISPKAQTTRNTIKAILVENETQIVFLDTPGIFIPQKNRPLERSIVKSAWQAVKDVDMVCLLIDGEKGFSEKDITILDDLKKHQIKPIIIINKVDIIKRVRVLPIIDEIAKTYELTDIFIISALTGEGVDKLKEFLINKCPEAEWTYENDEITDASLSFLASEITREKLFLNLYEDLPYSLMVKNDSWQNFDNGEIKIYQTIYVLKESQKMIIIGNKGAMIKKVGQEAREDISKITNCKVHLFLFAKVKKDWINKESY